MARKNLLKGLMDPVQAAKPASSAPSPVPQARSGKGAVGAVSRSIADLKARSIIELDPFKIEPGGMQDRLETDDGEDKALLEAIREYGQQVPVLVRPHPEKEGVYQIVYGRRRVLALRDLGQPVKALVRDLDDKELVVAQGQENTARRDLSFIEKASFARQMADAGYSRKVICDALTVDKTVISRMFAILESLPRELIEAIGSAPSVGRGRWSELSSLIAEENVDLETLIVTAQFADGSKSSDDRFEAVFRKAQNRVLPPAPALQEVPQTLKGADGEPLGTVLRSTRQTTLKLTARDGFEDWLLDHLPDLHRQWRDGEQTP